MNPQESKNILVPTFSSITLVNPYDVLYVKAMQNYCTVHLQDGNQILASISFKTTLLLFDTYNFYRCHRSYAVQISKVVRYLKNGNVELEGKVLVPVARRRKMEFLKMIEKGS